ncbi:ACP S-malonyltransferase [Candidatus Omnitrophota bacterium]
MKQLCYLFPGQGAQYVGMGKDLYETSVEARNVFTKAQEALPGLDIKRLCFEGPIEELTQTANSQVSILVTSIAALEALKQRIEPQQKDVKVVACAGLSLGELTSLVAAKSIEFSDAVRLVRRRGELMEEASVQNPGSMASIIGFSFEELKSVCDENNSEIANLNCPGQIVISGAKESVKSSMALALKKGAKKAIALNVSGGFHSSLMKDAARLFKIELDKSKFLTPEIGVLSNVSAEYEKTPEEIRENLIRQLYSPVRWEDSIRKIAAQGIDCFLEIGPGKVLKGLLRRIDASLKVQNIEKMADINNLIL